MDHLSHLCSDLPVSCLTCLCRRQSVRGSSDSPVSDSPVSVSLVSDSPVSVGGSLSGDHLTLDVCELCPELIERIHCVVVPQSEAYNLTVRVAAL